MAPSRPEGLSRNTFRYFQPNRQASPSEVHIEILDARDVLVGFFYSLNGLALTGRGHDATFPAWVECVSRRGPLQRLG
jgi:hypothetical protein